MSLHLANYPGAGTVANTPPAGPLRLLFWESTVGCNLACVHCRRLEVSQALSKFDLTSRQAKEMIQTLPQIGRPILVFSGGEPLMRPDVYELAEYAKSFKLPTALATNGTMIDGAVARKIVDAGFDHAPDIGLRGWPRSGDDDREGVGAQSTLADLLRRVAKIHAGQIDVAHDDIDHRHHRLA